jgi:hypothetical protein
VDAADLFAVRGRLPAMAGSLRELSRPDRWQDAWQLARRLGPAMAPAARAGFRNETGAQKRAAWLVATAQPRGQPTTIWLLECAADGRLSVEERTLALMLVALGDAPATRDARVAQLLEPGQEPAVRAAAALVNARAWPRAPLPPRWEAGKDLALLCAGAACEPPAVLAHEDGVERLRALVPASVQGVVLRAYFLADYAMEAAPLRRVHAVQVLRQADADLSLQRAAAYRLGKSAGDLPSSELQKSPAATAMLALTPETRHSLLERDRLPAIPELYGGEVDRRRMAVLYALAAPWEALAAAAPRIGGDGSIRGPVCLTLAWRALGGEAPPRPASERLVTELGAAPECAWLRAALGQKAGEAAADLGDARSEAALALAARGSLPDAAARAEVEGLLWRSGSHPFRALHEAFAELVRDVLLAGSDYVGGRLAVRSAPPLPRGLDATDRAFFEVAYAALEFVTEREPAPPTWLALR